MADLQERVLGLSPDRRRLLERELQRRGEAAVPALSLIFFSADAERESTAPYRLLIDSARFADRNGFHAIWTPERHFDVFGGLYPNPAVLAAAVATVTSRIGVRAGSVVSPLHEPVRIAEDWAVVDNLSDGRVGLAFAAGWHMNDFVLAPEKYDERHDIQFRDIDLVRELWAGRALPRTGPDRSEVEVVTFPRPKQQSLPVWVTVSSNPQTWVRAAEVGANVLTGLMVTSLEEVAERVAVYRRALARNGHDPTSRSVTLMVHTFVGEDEQQVEATVRAPLSDYLRRHIGLYEKQIAGRDSSIDVDAITEEDREALVNLAYDRYTTTRAMIGTRAVCREFALRLGGIGVDEIACLVDFGIDHGSTMEGLQRLATIGEDPARFVGG